MKNEIVIATRGSDLALVQTHNAMGELSQLGFKVTKKIITTKGDTDYRPFLQIKGDGFFTKELERALLSNEAQLAIHSSKDLPSLVHKELPWLSFSNRASSKDVLVIKKHLWGANAPLPGVTIGTSSPRRRAQIQHYWPHCKVVELRGNVPTRFKKVSESDLDATLLAKAGLDRLGGWKKFSDNDSVQVIELDWVTAPCQGIVAVQSHSDFSKVADSLANRELHEIALCEKSFLAFLGGGCHLPLGVKIEKVSPQKFQLDCFYAETNSNSELETLEFKLSDSNLTSLVRKGFRSLVDQKPKQQKQIWLTQPIQQHHRIAKVLENENLSANFWPLVEIQPCWDFKSIKNRLIQSSEMQTGLVFSSHFASTIFVREFLTDPQIEKQILKSPIFCVGQRTASPLIEVGLKPISADEESASAKNLFKLLQTQTQIENWLLLGTLDSQIKSYFQNSQLKFDLLELYSTVKSHSVISKTPDFQENDAIVFSSPSAVKTFAEIPQIKQKIKDFNMKLFSFGPSTSLQLDQCGFDHFKNTKSGSWIQMSRLIKETL